MVYLSIDDTRNRGGNTYRYTLTVQYDDPHEPNDSPATATPIELGTTLGGIIASDDFDYYSFEALAEEEFAVENAFIGIAVLDPAGQEIAYLPPFFDGIFRVQQSGGHYLKAVPDYGVGPYSLRLNRIDRPLLLSFTTAGTLGGVAFEPGDVLRYSPIMDTWQMYFDASDMGLKGNLVALDGPFNIWMSFAGTQTVAGLGKVLPQDVIYFEGQTIDGQTSGQLSWYIDGSTTGLTLASEAIDALGRNQHYYLTASTKGNARVKGNGQQISAQGNDILTFFETAWDSPRQGYWLLEFDGATLGVPGANPVALDSLSTRPEGYYLVFDRAVTLGGVTYDRDDIIRCWLTPELDACATTELMWDGAFTGGYHIDALDGMPFEYAND